MDAGRLLICLSTMVSGAWSSLFSALIPPGAWSCAPHELQADSGVCLLSPRPCPVGSYALRLSKVFFSFRRSVFLVPCIVPGRRLPCIFPGFRRERQDHVGFHKPARMGACPNRARRHLDQWIQS